MPGDQRAAINERKRPLRTYQGHITRLFPLMDSKRTITTEKVKSKRGLVDKKRLNLANGQKGEKRGIKCYSK